MKPRIWRLGVILLILPTLVQPFAQASGSSGARDENCSVVDIAVRVPAANAAPLVPSPPFTVATDELGRALLSILMVRCEAVTINDGEPRPTIFAHPIVGVEWPEEFAGDEPVITPPNEFHAYQLWMITDNPDLARYLRDHGSAGSDVRHVSDLSFVEGEDGSFRFEAPEPTPSPFTATAQLGPTTPVGVELKPRFYWRTPRGLQVIDDDLVPEFRPGALESWVIQPADGSQLDVLLCDGPRSSDDTGAPLADESLHGKFDLATFSTQLRDTALGPIGEAQCSSEQEDARVQRE